MTKDQIWLVASLIFTGIVVILLILALTGVLKKADPQIPIEKDPTDDPNFPPKNY